MMSIMAITMATMSPSSSLSSQWSTKMYDDYSVNDDNSVAIIIIIIIAANYKESVMMMMMMMMIIL